MSTVLPKCNLGETIWVFENPTPGQPAKVSEANWAIPLGDGSLLIEPKNYVLLSEFQAFITSAVYEPDEGLRMAASSIGGTLNSLEVLAVFMTGKNIKSVSQLTSDLTWEYVSYLEDEYAEDGSDLGRARELTYSSSYRLLHVISQIYTQRKGMTTRGVGAIPEPPFDGRTVHDVVVNDLGLQRNGKLAPIPDLVAIPALGRAYQYISVGAADVIRLQDAILNCYGVMPYQQANGVARDLISNFEFAIDPFTGQPWHLRIEPAKREMLDGREVDLSVIQGFRRLVLELVAACTICIQGGTGIRAHELLGLKSGRANTKGFPNCINSRLSSDGVMEILFVQGVTAKRTVAETEWLLGSRPLGSEFVPAPALAIDVLETLLIPWRKLGDSNSLLVNFKSARGLPRLRNSISKFNASSLTYLQKEFATMACIESGQMGVGEAKKQGRLIRAHRWRPTFAQFVFRTSPRLLIPLRDHYKHISEAITDAGYVGNDAALLEDLESERIQETSRMLIEISMGKTVGAGSVKHLIGRFSEELGLQIESSTGDSLNEKALAFVRQHDIRIWNSAYAACFMNLLPQASKCNDMNEIPESVRSQPIYSLRSPGICASCRCCWIRHEHRSFWEARLATNEAIAYEEREIGGILTGSSIASRRARQSRAILNSIDGITTGETG